MGTDDQFHKRKAKSADRLERRKAKRSPYEKVLIVCEGEKTEPSYFKRCIEHYKLNTANVVVDSSCGSSPKSVYEHAVKLWKAENKKGGPYDRVYCVFDQDTHSTFEETIRKISERKPKDCFHAAASAPCFEYWLLLHHKYTTETYVATGKLSVGEAVLKELKKKMPKYEKNNSDIFDSLFLKIEVAKKNAAQSLEYAKKHKLDNPYTTIHELIDYLQNLKN